MSHGKCVREGAPVSLSCLVSASDRYWCAAARSQGRLWDIGGREQLVKEVEVRPSLCEPFSSSTIVRMGI